MAIPNAKFLLRNKVRSINGFFLVRLWAKKIHAKINARKNSAVIISNKGGLPEASSSAIKIKNLSIRNLQKEIEKIINNEKYKKNLQKKIYKNFKLTNELAAKKIDEYRIKIIKT